MLRDSVSSIRSHWAMGRIESKWAAAAFSSAAKAASAKSVRLRAGICRLCPLVLGCECVLDGHRDLAGEQLNLSTSRSAGATGVVDLDAGLICHLQEGPVGRRLSKFCNSRSYIDGNRVRMID